MAELGKSANLKITVAGQELTPPPGWFDVEVLATFDNGDSQANITTDSFDFYLDAYTYLKGRIEAGLTGGFGIFEPVPVKIEAISTLGTYSAFEGGIKLAESTQNDTEGIISAPIDKDSGIRTLDERLSGLSYLFLYETGVIVDSDFFDVDYVVDKPDKVIDAFVASLTIFSLARELADLIRQIAKDGAIVGGIAPSGATGPAGAAIYAAASLVINVIYAAALLALILDLARDLVAAFSLPLRTHKGIKLCDLLEKPLAHLGYSFASTIPELDNVVYLPSNQAADAEDGVKGFISQPGTIKRGIPNAGDFGYLCSEIFQLCRNLFNARYQIVNNTVQFHSENSSYWIRNSQYILPDVLEGPYRRNTEDLKDSHLLSFSTDVSDQYTVNEYKGTSYQVITEAISIGPSARDNITGLEEVSFNVALGSRKDSLNGFERFLATLAGVIDSAVNAFGGNSNVRGEIEGKVGVLRVARNNHTIPKLLYYQGDRLPINHRDLFSAKTLWESYHSYKSFIANNFQRQRKVFEEVEVPFGFEDFVQVIENSYCQTADGKQAKIERLVWNMARDKAIIDYWVEEVYTKNLKETYIEPTVNGAIVTTS